MNESHPLVDALFGGLYHCTGYEQFQKIVDVGVIEPTGSNPCTFDQTQNSFAREIRAVSLLDLISPPKDDCLYQIPAWSSLFTKNFPAVAMKLDKKILTQVGLVRNNAAALWNTTPGNPYRVYMPKVEVWYQGKLPLELMTVCLVVVYMPKGDDECISILPGKGLLDKVRSAVLKVRRACGGNPWEAERKRNLPPFRL